MGYLFGFAFTQFLLTWLVLLFVKPKTQTQFTVWTVLICFIIGIGNIANNKAPAFAIVNSVVASAIVYVLLWLIYRKDFDVQDEQITQLTLHPYPSLKGRPVDYPDFVFGRYINQRDGTEYLELKVDGTFYLLRRKMNLAGSFFLDDEVLTLTLVTGQSSKARLKDCLVTDEDGQTWVHKRMIEK